MAITQDFESGDPSSILGGTLIKTPIVQLVNISLINWGSMVQVHLGINALLASW